MDLAAELAALRELGLSRFAGVAEVEALEAERVALLGRSGRLKELKDAFAAASVEDKRRCGKLLGEVDQALREAWQAAQRRLAAATDDPPLDVTLPGSQRAQGSIHPLAQVAAEVEAVFTSMGFTVVDGPHIEEDAFNFGKLNIPADHPARDSHDTFWLDDGRLLRTHTSAVQARVYPGCELPLRRVVVGTVFRYEEVDATHDNTFQQVEGFVVDEGITVAHLVGTLKTMIAAVLRREDVEVRLRPSFFPFVEPGFEVDVRCTSAGSGRFANWVELLGCGMIHPKVLAAGGIDAERYQGFAFGLGLERLTMIRHGIQDIRVFRGADVRALAAFGA